MAIKANLSHAFDAALTEGMSARHDEGAVPARVSVPLRAQRARDKHHPVTSHLVLPTLLYNRGIQLVEITRLEG